MICHRLTTHPHLGDHVILTGAVRNIRLARPDIHFVRTMQFSEVWNNNPDVHDMDEGGFFLRIEEKDVDYGSVMEERFGSNGNCVEGFTKVLCQLLKIDEVPAVQKTPVLYLTDEEKEWGRQFEDAIVLNANCQTSTLSKGYPHWQKVVDALKGERIIQVGGNLDKDLSLDLAGVEDWRGRTTIRQLFAMIHGCRLVVSPPSSFTNIAGAFGKRQLVLNGSREADVLTEYPNAVHFSRKSKCAGIPEIGAWGIENGCVSLGTKGFRTCPMAGGSYVEKGERLWCKCMWDIRPNDIAKKIKGLLV